MFIDGVRRESFVKTLVGTLPDNTRFVPGLARLLSPLAPPIVKMLLIVALVFVTPPVLGSEHDLKKNNKFGIHLLQPSDGDIQKAAELVNGSGGKWGYVTLVIQENDRDVRRWQDLFDELRKYNLIPIVRIATNPEGANWRRPNPEDVAGWVHFLDSLNWVVKNRYIILFNEINHASEWGGNVDAQGYAEMAKLFAQKLREKNPDFFIMLGGLDASAPSRLPLYEDSGIYLRKVIEKISVDDFNRLFSGLSSHSYPNPAFAGSPYASGKGTVRTYAWELDLLKSIGVKDLPVFITETGWHAGNVTREQIAAYFKTVYEEVWLPDNRVVAVTPFVLNYEGEPFIHFSWAVPGNGDYYPQYTVVENIPKEEGDPPIVERGSMDVEFPREMVVQSSYRLRVFLQNSGQAIWSNNNGYSVVLNGAPDLNVVASYLYPIEPNASGFIDLLIKTGTKAASGITQIRLMRGKDVALETDAWNFQIVPFPQLLFQTSYYPKLRVNADNIEIQVFDPDENLVYKQTNVKIKEGRGMLDSVPNVVVGRRYRIVVLRQYYLPRQNHIVIRRGLNKIGFPIMFPLDFNKDGTFDVRDIGAVFGDLKVMRLLIP